jgi:hypothetical protein
LTTCILTGAIDLIVAPAPVKYKLSELNALGIDN